MRERPNHASDSASSSNSNFPLPQEYKAWEQLLYTYAETYTPDPEVATTMIPSQTCRCPGDKRVIMLTSLTDTNPGRRFIKCATRGQEGGCTYFSWVDDDFNPRAKQLIRVLRDALRHAKSQTMGHGQGVASNATSLLNEEVQQLRFQLANAAQIERESFQLRFSMNRKNEEIENLRNELRRCETNAMVLINQIVDLNSQLQKEKMKTKCLIAGLMLFIILIVTKALAYLTTRCNCYQECSIQGATVPEE